MKENYFLDDGAYSALQIIVETAKQRVEGDKSLTADLLSKLSEPLEASEFRLKLQVRPAAHVALKVSVLAAPALSCTDSLYHPVSVGHASLSRCQWHLCQVLGGSPAKCCTC